MSAAPVVNPEIPYVGEVEGGLTPGKLVRIRGKVPSEAVRFAVNYQLGPTLNPRDDIALHVSPRFADGIISRSHIVSMNWGPFEDDGPMWIQPGEDFEMIILCDHAGYKIAINGKHFTEFAHRLPYEKVTHLVIDGDVEVSLIAYETVAVAPSRSARSATVSDVPSANYGPPPPGGLYPTLDTQGGYGPPPPAGYGPPPAGYGPPPAGYGPPPAGYGPSPYGGPNGYNPSQGYRPGYEKPEEEDTFSGCLDKVGLALGGLVAAGGVAAAMHAMNKKKEESEEEQEKSDASKKQTQSEGGFGNLGALGAALATSLATNALQRNLHAQQGYPPVESGAGGVLGSILGALGGSGAPSQPAYAPPPPASDPLSGALGSILGGVLGGGGGQQQPAYQPSGGYGYGGSGGYGNQQGSTGSNFLSGIGSAIGSSLFSSALDGLTKHGKDKSHGDSPRDRNPPSYGQSTPAAPPPSNSDSPPSSGGQKLTADEISKGLGLDD